MSNVKERPIIGITTGQMIPDGNTEIAIIGLRRPYVEAVRNSGGIPFIVPYSERMSSLDYVDIARCCDGWIFSGGGDFNPKFYRQEIDGSGEMKQGICNSRDVFELELMSLLIETGNLPALGICRGLQCLNIEGGGNLIQRIPRSDLHMPESQSYEGLNTLKHKVILSPNTHLAAIFAGRREIEVNTGHHQAVNELGVGLVVAARSVEDRIVEALEHDRAPFIGVQWHPEMMYEEMKPIFDWLVDLAWKNKNA